MLLKVCRLKVGIPETLELYGETRNCGYVGARAVGSATAT
jgi:hypothetical protein